MSRKAWENVGFAAGGFAVAVFLLWAGVIGAGGAQKNPVTLVLAVVLAVAAALAFVTAARRGAR